MPEEFTWRPKIESTETASFRTTEAKFGDGFKQTAGDGMNTRESVLDLTFVGRAPVVMAMKAFLDAHAGSRSFYFTPPTSTRGLFLCKTYQIARVGRMVTGLTATFEQTFRP